MLLSKNNSVNNDRFPRVIDNLPESLLLDKCNRCNFLRLLISSRIVPLNLLSFVINKIVKLTKLPIPKGISPKKKIVANRKIGKLG